MTGKRAFATIASGHGTSFITGRATASITGSLSDIRSRIAGGMNMAKYQNRKTTIDGMTFDSKHEANRYQELKLLERAGEIADLQRQVPFELLPAQKIGGAVLERSIRYVADFVYMQDGEKIVEDAKGVRTKDYILKRKLMLWRHGIQIKEV